MRQTRVTWRAVLIALVLIPFNSFWIVYMETVHYIAHSTNFSLLFHAIFNLTLLLILNAVLRRISPRLVLGQGELVTIYVMLCIAGTLAGHSMMQILPPTLAAPVGFATPENDWKNLFGHHYPDWLIVTDTKALTGYMATATKRPATLYIETHIRPWIVPVIAWTALICAFMFVMLCINAIIRKQWTERERLTYPLTQLPYEMTNPKSGLLKSRLLWISFSVVCIINILNGLHTFYPVVPSFQPRAYNLGKFFTTKPWDAIGYMALLVRPFLLGLIFLVPLDIAFSCWVFFFFWKAQLVLGEAWGFQKRPEFPEQSAGAYIALCVIAVWTGRHHFSRVIRSVWDRRLAGESEKEALPYNVAVYGVIAGFLFIVMFCWQAGMTWWGAAIFFTLLLMTNIGVTRIRAEVGSPVHDLHFAGPEILMLDAFGTRRVGPRTLSIISLFWFLTRAHYSDPMPHQLEGFRIADRSRMNQRRVFAVMLIAIVVGTVIAFWALLDAGYKHGASWGGEPLGRLNRWLIYPMHPDMYGIGYFSFGLLFGLFVMFMRVRFLWWPLHPAGYAVSSTYGMRDTWFMFFTAWLIKWILLKAGGMKAHRAAIPFFLGMVLADFLVGGCWALLGVLLNVRTYGFTAWW